MSCWRSMDYCRVFWNVLVIDKGKREKEGNKWNWICPWVWSWHGLLFLGSVHRYMHPIQSTETCFEVLIEVSFFTDLGGNVLHSSGTLCSTWAEWLRLRCLARWMLRSSGTFGSTWAGWLRLRRLACCAWSLRFKYSVRAVGLVAYGWYRVARAWEISQAYEVFRGDLYVLRFKTRLTRELRPKV